MELLFSIRHYQYLNIAGQPIFYTGSSPATIAAAFGSVPQKDWIDVTGDVAEVNKIQFTFTRDRDNKGDSTPGSVQSKKASSGSIRIEGFAYQFIKEWLINHVAAPLNAVEVMITDTSCGDYTGLIIKSSQIKWCEDGMCEFDVTLQQEDPYWSCIQKTLVTDNHKGWFQNKPTNGKKHPRFSYCNEIRPNGILVMQWFMTGVVMGSTLMVMIPLLTVFNVVAAIINVIIGTINSIIAIVGGNSLSSVNWQTIPYIDLNDIIDSYRQYYVESAGCGREHPAPLIRDYIQNVCDKCGITVDQITAPIFFSQKISLQASSGYRSNVKNPYFNACYLYAPVKRGIRRFKNINYFGSPNANNDEFFIEENAPMLTLEDFLNQLKEVFNAEWRIRGGKLYFWRKDWFLTGQHLYDFTDGSDDRLKILEGICFEWNEVAYPASMVGLWSHDSVDTCGNEAMQPMNGDALSFFKTEDIPIFTGILQKTTRHFGATKFRFDGASTDYIYDAMQVVVNGQILQPWTIPQMKSIDDWMIKYANYALLLKDETCSLAKILIWDGGSYLNARCVMDTVPVNNSLVWGEPYPNHKYNHTPWKNKYPPKTDVIGHALVSGGAQSGEYRVADYFNSLVAHAAARLVNFPMYFNPGYENTLWDWFHWIDDPRQNPKLHLNWSCKIGLCCEDLKRLNLLGDGTDAMLMERVKLPSNFYHDGIIKEITVSYDTDDEVGQYIELKGEV